MADTKRTGEAIESPRAIHDCHALLLWIIPPLDKFPRLRGYTLGERIETLLLQVLERLLEAACTFGRDKTRALQRASQHLNVVRHWRWRDRLGAVAASSKPSARTEKKTLFKACARRLK